MSDPVNSPSHYTEGRSEAYEPINVIEAWKLDFCLGNAVKYISRAGRKDPEKEVEDLEKAIWYVRRRISQLTPPPDNVVELAQPEPSPTEYRAASDRTIEFIGRTWEKVVLRDATFCEVVNGQSRLTAIRKYVRVNGTPLDEWIQKQESCQHTRVQTYVAARGNDRRVLVRRCDDCRRTWEL